MNVYEEMLKQGQPAVPPIAEGPAFDLSLSQVEVPTGEINIAPEAGQGKELAPDVIVPKEEFRNVSTPVTMDIQAGAEPEGIFAPPEDNIYDFMLRQQDPEALAERKDRAIQLRRAVENGLEIPEEWRRQIAHDSLMGETSGTQLRATASGIGEGLWESIKHPIEKIVKPAYGMFVEAPAYAAGELLSDKSPAALSGLAQGAEEGLFGLGKMGSGMVSYLSGTFSDPVEASLRDMERKNALSRTAAATKGWFSEHWANPDEAPNSEKVGELIGQIPVFAAGKPAFQLIEKGVGNASKFAVESALPYATGKTIQGISHAIPVTIAGKTALAGHPIGALAILAARYGATRDLPLGMGRLGHFFVGAPMKAVDRFGASIAGTAGAEDVFSVARQAVADQIKADEAGLAALKKQHAGKIPNVDNRSIKRENLNPTEQKLRKLQDDINGLKLKHQSLKKWETLGGYFQRSAQTGLNIAGLTTIPSTAFAGLAGLAAQPADAENVAKESTEGGMAFIAPLSVFGARSARLTALGDSFAREGRARMRSDADHAAGRSEMSREDRRQIDIANGVFGKIGRSISVLLPEAFAKMLEANGEHVQRDAKGRAVNLQAGYTDAAGNAYIRSDRAKAGGHELTHMIDSVAGNIATEAYKSSLAAANDPKMAAAVKTFFDTYMDRIRKSDPSYKNLTDDAIYSEAAAELGRYILQSTPLENFYGGGTIIDSLGQKIGRLTDRIKGGDQIRTIPGLNAPFTSAQLRDVIDAFYRAGRGLKRGETVDPKTAEPIRFEEPVGMRDDLRKALAKGANVKGDVEEFINQAFQHMAERQEPPNLARAFWYARKAADGKPLEPSDAEIQQLVRKKIAAGADPNDAMMAAAVELGGPRPKPQAIIAKIPMKREPVFMPDDHPEAINSEHPAAFRTPDGVVHVGTWHPDAWADLTTKYPAEQLGKWLKEFGDYYAERGFVNNKGDFLTPEQATEAALKRKQMTITDVKRLFRGKTWGDDPRGLESLAFREAARKGQAMPEVNIGLNIGDQTALKPEDVIEALRGAGVKVMGDYKIHKSGTEPTFVATLNRDLLPDEANAVAEALQQEAIAQVVGHRGYLYGPAAEKWKPFNPESFIRPSGKTLAEEPYKGGEIGTSAMWDTSIVDPESFKLRDSAVEATGADPKKFFLEQKPDVRKKLTAFMKERGAKYMPDLNPLQVAEGVKMELDRRAEEFIYDTPYIQKFGKDENGLYSLMAALSDSVRGEPLPSDIQTIHDKLGIDPSQLDVIIDGFRNTFKPDEIAEIQQRVRIGSLPTESSEPFFDAKAFQKFLRDTNEKGKTEAPRPEGWQEGGEPRKTGPSSNDYTNPWTTTEREYHDGSWEDVGPILENGGAVWLVDSKGNPELIRNGDEAAAYFSENYQPRGWMIASKGDKGGQFMPDVSPAGELKWKERDFNMSPDQLEQFLMFGKMVQGKPSARQAPALAGFLTDLLGKYDTTSPLEGLRAAVNEPEYLAATDALREKWGVHTGSEAWSKELRDRTRKGLPFEPVGDLQALARQYKLSPWQDNIPFFHTLAETNLPDLKTITKDQLQQIKSIGPATADFFKLHTDPEYSHRGKLDTHILGWLRDNVDETAPKNSPQDQATYEKYHTMFADAAHEMGVTPEALDMRIWKERSGNFSPDTDLARSIAHEAHKDQERKYTGEPYTKHLEDVASLVSDDLKPAALLHDIFEDTPLRVADLRSLGVPEETIQLIRKVTLRPNEDYQHYIERVASDPEASAIKAPDLYANLRTLPEGDSLRGRYIKALNTLIPSDDVIAEALKGSKGRTDRWTKVGAHRDLPEGTPLSGRIDVPAFVKSGRYPIAAHLKNIGTVQGYDGILRLANPSTYVSERGAKLIREGQDKFPMAAVNGKYIKSREFPKNIGDWALSGFNPVKHSYFYEKGTERPIIAGDEALLTGNSVYWKNPVYGNPEGFLYMPDVPTAIDRAAIRRKSDGQIFTGNQNDTHFMIPNRAPEVADYLGMNGHKLYEEGFVDHNRNWYDREQAHNQTKAMGQLPHDYQGEYMNELNVTDLRKGAFMPSTHPDAIKQPALRDDITGEIHTAPVGYHSMIPLPKSVYDYEKLTSGFVTNKGEFLDRTQALQRALEHDQISKAAADPRNWTETAIDQQLHAPDVREGSTSVNWQYMPDTPEAAVAATRAAQKEFPEALPLGWKKDNNGDVKMYAVKDKKTGRIKGYEAKPVEYAYDLARQPVAMKAAEGIRDKGLRLEAQTDAASEKLVEFFNEVKDNPEAMQAKGWYRELRNLLLDKLGGNEQDLILFTRLLAATSPNTNPGVNFGFTFDVWNKFKKGDYDDIILKYKDALDQLQQGTLKLKNGKEVTSAKDFETYINQHQLIPYRDTPRGRKRPGMHSLRVMDTLSNHFDRIKGLKINQFAHNLAQTDLRATIDLWAARSLHRLLNDGNKNPWRILPMNEKGIVPQDFSFGQAAFGKAAKKLGISPDDLQAILWFAEKIHYDKQGWSNYLDKGDFRPLVERMVPQEKGTFSLRDLEPPQ